MLLRQSLIMEYTNIDAYIPIDKTDTINKMLMDLFYGRASDAIAFVTNYEPQDELPQDVKYAGLALQDWIAGEPVRVGQAGKLIRSLSFYSWNLGTSKDFIREGTLDNRYICNDPRIITYSQRQLLELKDETTQFASAKVLLGDHERLTDAPFKLVQAYDSFDEWHCARRDGKMWSTKSDITLERQAHAMIEYVLTGDTDFPLVHPEDYCVGRSMGKITPEEGLIRWKRLQNQESKRIDATEVALTEAESGLPITPRDHRVIMGGVLRQIKLGEPINAVYMHEVGKSWPQFPKFAEYLDQLRH